ncbi:MAG TPA: ABC transporter ATP-binding protein [Verrucomicrobiae bacterium]|nr:ABC transporter ATP-binding protein [Verrucomicrobiae bacterium]
MQPVIQLENLVKTYHAGEVEIPAVRGVSLEVLPGEFVAVMGASGSGKSTLMNVIGCLDRPTSGRYSLDGVEMSQLEADAQADIRNRKIGFVFQNFNLLARTSTLENIELPLLYSRPSLCRQEQRARALNALAMTGLTDRSAHHPNQLSGGQQQRVAIGRALVNRPELLLADEPTGNLDTRTGIEIMGIFQNLNRMGLTIIMVTHEPHIARFCQRTVVMRDGHIISNDPVQHRLDATSKLEQERLALQLAS